MQYRESATIMTLPCTAQLYLALLALAAVAVLCSVVAAAPIPQPAQLLLAGRFTVLVVGANLRPLHFAHKTKITLGTSVTFAVALLVEPALAILIALVGVTLAGLLQSAPPV